MCADLNAVQETSPQRFTLVAPARHILDIKKSRFLAQAIPIASPEAAHSALARIREPSATHHCWAWRLGDQYRFHDDGEPAGTAGRPILMAIDGQRMDGVLVVVARWFGGIKLGAGGLARAYGGAAAACLRLAERVPQVTRSRWHLRCPFDAWARIEARLQAFAPRIGQETFDAEGVVLELALPVAFVAAAQDCIRDASRGRAALVPLDADLPQT
ncbi:IMPACT family protein [Aerosticca soli]|nr:YigZ family protein [Aerosticca soli]